MCIILYKPQGIKLPNKQVLETCFHNNPDGAGFMFNYKGQVHIRKGFMDFSSFEENLKATLKYIDEVKTPMVLHFRITTQGGTNQACTHPFPLSRNMSDLRQLQCVSEIGVAHNGIISLTTEYGGGYYGYSSYQAKKIDYSDTMKFITDYLSLIIKTPKYYKDDDTLELIERLADSKLAILDSNGHCELIGHFIKDDGIYYSNESYKPRVYKTTTKTTYSKTKSSKKKDYDYTIFDEIEDNGYDYNWCNDYNENEYYEAFYNYNTGMYDFTHSSTCPIDDCIADYCQWCEDCDNCDKIMPIEIANLLTKDNVLLTKTKQFYRKGGNLYGISYDEDENLYEVEYIERDDYCEPVSARKLDNTK